MFYNTDSVLPIMDFALMSDDPGNGKKEGMPDMDEDDNDPHRGITDTPPQHEELLPDDEDDDAFEDEEFDEELELDEDEEDDDEG